MIVYIYVTHKSSIDLLYVLKIKKLTAITLLILFLLRKFLCSLLPNRGPRWLSTTNRG